MTSLSRILNAPLPPPPPASKKSTFMNPCGRLGCDHVFEYAGGSPFQDLANLVARHAPYCTGYKHGATLQCETEWQPSDKVVEGIVNPTAEMYHNFGGIANDFVQDRAYNELPQRVHCENSGTEDSDMSSAASINTRRKSNNKGTKAHASAGENSVTVSTIGIADLPAARKPKKTARSEAQRRAYLNRDAWAKEVHPDHILCRGCNREIKLDGRSRYYPSLWEKHRLRCVGVQAGLIREGRPIEVEEPVVVEDPMAPRKSYYRENA
ncbi:hypothetical protein C8R46DRAFT_1351210 [Mycena filopes]|nr:hypothetical protein C8R46DRAFT_1351210 [Mycena filopes]